MATSLAQIIKDNPGCTAVVDNDCWTLYNKDGDEIADDESVKGYFIGSNCYGQDILYALAEIVGIEIENP